MITRSAIPKPFKGEWAKHKRRLERLFDADRQACRKTVYERDGGCCVRCGKPLKLLPSEARHELEIANINEIVPRSLGGDPCDPANCNTLCSQCHTGKGYHAK